MKTNPDDLINDNLNGLTKREYFAIMIAQNLMRNYGNSYIAKDAIGFADLLIQKLNEGKPDEV